MTSLTKNPHPPTKIYFRVRTRWLAESFDLLNSTLPRLAPELRARKATCDPVVLTRKSPKAPGRQSIDWNAKKHPHLVIYLCADIFIFCQYRKLQNMVLYEISISINKIGANFQIMLGICKNQENNLSMSPHDSVFLDSGGRPLVRVIYLQTFWIFTAHTTIVSFLTSNKLFVNLSQKYFELIRHWKTEQRVTLWRHNKFEIKLSLSKPQGRAL